VKTRDLMELAGRNLREAMLRNSLTTLGIAVGVASLVAMMSLGIGLQTMAMSRLQSSGLFNRVYVTPRPIGGSLTGRGGRGGRGRTQQGDDVPTPGLPPQLQPPTKPLTTTVRKQLAAMPNVVSVFPELRFTADLRYGGTGHVTAASSVPFDARGTGQFDNVTGKFFSGPNANEAILHTDLAQQIADQGNFKADDLIGQEVTIRYPERKPVEAPPNQRPQDIVANGEFGQGFTIQSAEVKVKIVGLVGGESAGPTGFGGSRIMLPLEMVERLNAVQGFDVREVVANPGETIYPTLTMLIDNPNHVQVVEDAVKQMGFGAFSLFDAAKNLQLLFKVFDSFLLVFGSLALAVASLGIVNTLVMAILERRHEIGVLKALGAADSDVRQLFFAEAGVMGLVGGVLGVLFGWSLGKLINFGLNKWLEGQNLHPEKIWLVPLWLVGAAIGFSIVVSLLAGLYPASRAAKLDPVKALRYE
jgi:putative ABC transport system permease protein